MVAKIRALLRLLFPKLFDYISINIVRFVPEINTRDLHFVLNHDGFKFFMDCCERKARLLEDGTYKGVRFVEDEAIAMRKKLEPEKPKPMPRNFVASLSDDEGLVKESEQLSG